MIEWYLISTLSLLAKSLACGIALTLNANTKAEDAAANDMSDSLIAQTAPDNTLTFTNEFPNLSKATFIASSDP